MDDAATLLTIIDVLYDSVVDDSKWSIAMRSVTEYLGATGYGEVIADPSRGKITYCKSSIDPRFDQLYLDYYSTREVRLAPALAFPVGVVLTEDVLIEHSELVCSEVYGDLLLPYDVPHFMFAWLQKEQRAVRTIAFEGSKSHGAFTREYVDRFSVVMPHLRRAVQLRELLLSARQSQLTYREALDSLSVGVALLDDRGLVIHMTRIAQSTTCNGQGLRLLHGQLHALTAEEDQLLQRAIQQAIRPRLTATPEEPLRIRRPGIRPALTLNVIPLTSQDEWLITPQPVALVLIADPERAPQPKAALMKRTFGLTNAESALAGALFNGLSLRDAAESLGRSINTCKTQLKSIYVKTACHNHVELAKQLMWASITRVGIHLFYALTWFSLNCAGVIDV